MSQAISGAALSISPEAQVIIRDDATWVHYNGIPICELGSKKGLADKWVHPEPGYVHGRCKMIMRKGGRCNNGVREGWTVCHKHGAGTEGKPGGRPVITGRHSKYLPQGLIPKYEESLLDPDYISMASELALTDSRIAELLDKIATSTESGPAWLLVRQALMKLKRREHEDDVVDVEGILEDALSNHITEDAIWSNIFTLIDTRRKLADTERRRVVDAQQYLTYREANAMLARVMDAVITNVTDPLVIRAISENLRTFAIRK